MFNNKLKTLFVALLLTSLTLVFGCSSNPPDDVFKEALTWNLCRNLMNQVEEQAVNKCIKENIGVTKTWEKMKIANKYKKTIDGEKYTVYELEITQKGNKPGKMPPIAMIKRGNKWEWRTP